MSAASSAASINGRVMSLLALPDRRFSNVTIDQAVAADWRPLYDFGGQRRAMARKCGVVIVLALCTFAAVFAQTLSTGVVKKASMGGITEYDFPNGLRVLLYP